MHSTFAGPATTQPGSRRSEASIPRQLSELASDDASVRAAARAGLMRLPREKLPELSDVIKSGGPLLPSQRVALHQIVQEIYLAGEQYVQEPKSGFLGVMMGEASLEQSDIVPENDGPHTLGVIVADRIPGFCAARRLLDGDVILGAAAPVKLFRNASDLQLTIGDLRPGTRVRLLVLRRGAVIDVPLTLDSRPAQVTTTEALDDFRIKRHKDFENYWRREFEALVRPTVG